MFSHFEVVNENNYDMFINLYFSDRGGVSIVLDKRSRYSFFNWFGNDYYVTANDDFSELIVSDARFNFYLVGSRKVSLIDSIPYKTYKYWKDNIKYTRKHKLPAWF